MYTDFKHYEYQKYFKDINKSFDHWILIFLNECYETLVGAKGGLFYFPNKSENTETRKGGRKAPKIKF